MNILGKNLRKKYIKLISNDAMNYTNSINMMSSTSMRCLSSARSFLAGFVPSNENSVKINTIPYYLDNVNYS